MCLLYCHFDRKCLKKRMLSWPSILSRKCPLLAQSFGEGRVDKGGGGVFLKKILKKNMYLILDQHF